MDVFTESKKAHSEPEDLARTVRTLFEAQRAHQRQVARATAEERIEKLKRLRQAVLERREVLQAAVYKDFRKPAAEVDLTEITVTLSEIKHAIDHLKTWMAPQKVKAPVTLLGTQAEVRYEPKGVGLIISPWNYPITLALGPLVSAVAAGCCAVLKPSEFTPHTNAALHDLLAATFEASEVAVVEGDATAAQALLALPFDHIYFTGSPGVGKLVMKAAAEHLTSVTLELGGKSPAVVDASADVALTAQKIVQGKFLNAGQTCIAPDYVLVHEAVHGALLAALREQIHERYGPTEEQREASPDFARVIHARHWQRLHAMLEEALADGADLIVGGQATASTRYLAPTVLANVSREGTLMEEEIFGPILPVLSVASLQEAISIVNAKPKPLALYVFAEDAAAREQVLEETSAGGSCVNETLLHFLHPELPFGGIGHSGIGRGHGIYGFRAFSNERPVLTQKLKPSPLQFFLPPYSARTRRFIDWLLKYY
jgi:aldehyde dehydrogenase (NAD+)